MRLVDGVDRDGLGDPRVGEDDVDTAVLAADPFVGPLEITEVPDVALDADGAVPDLGDRRRLSRRLSSKALPRASNMRSRRSDGHSRRPPSPTAR